MARLGPPPGDPSALILALRAEAHAFQAAAFAAGTLAAATTALRSYAAFCYITGRWPDPHTGITDEDLILYITFLARTLSIATIENYVSLGVARFHRETGMPWTALSQRFQVHITFRGIKRVRGSTAPANRKLAATPALLQQLRTRYDLQTGEGLAHYTAILVMFFGLLRKSNVMTGRHTERHVLKRQDVTRNADGSYTLLLRTAKTLQVAGARTVPIILASDPANPLCPASHLAAYLAATRHRQPTDDLFGSYQKSRARGVWEWVPLTYDTFLPAFKAALSRCGFDAARYGAHSLRRGGATHAFFCGIPDHLIMLLGDWKSPVWHDYVEVQAELRRRAAAALTGGTRFSLD